ncbi:hypothetical protein PF008_g6991 [Phytophthora fragariae]|uniref:Uncharacterized protein n=1 Tax=Phytophthora fragariae TaxID=53985 RepID=A0A6G0S4U7_9STRA|nr:hypothetical protein PF008_g6991 [Phytophthora fragariae]
MNSLRKAAAAVTTAATALTRRCSGPAACKNDESSCGEEGPFPADSPQAAPRKGQWVAACKRSALPFSNGASDPKVSVGQPQAMPPSQFRGNGGTLKRRGIGRKGAGRKPAGTPSIGRKDHA